jgi:L-alanine-DL-glutamate epimerase-like enolase superfamily enzyme
MSTSLNARMGRRSLAQWEAVDRPPLSDGAIELTEAPGLGWELDEDFMDAHRVRR